MLAIPIGARVGRQAITAFIPKAVITTHRRGLSDPLRTIPLTNAYCNILINPTIVIYFNYRKDSYFTTSYLELKDIGDIKEIEEGETSNELGKEEP